MRNVEDRDPGVAQVFNQGEDLLPLHQVEGGRWLVKDHQPRVVGECLRNLHELRLPGGEVADLGRGREVRSDSFEVRSRVPHQSSLRDVESRILTESVDEDVLCDRQVREQAYLLMDRRHPLVPQSRDPGRPGLAENGDVTGVHAQVSANEVLDRRLACAILAREGDNLSCGDREAHILCSGNTAKRLGYTPKVNRDGARGCGYFVVSLVVQDDLFGVEMGQGVREIRVIAAETHC